MIMETARRETRNLALVACAINLILPLGFLIYAAVTDEVFYELFWGESDAISWYSSVQLLIVGGIAYLNYRVSMLVWKLEGGANSSRPWIWAVFAAGFVFLGIDERFEIHEALRDNVLEPGGLFVNIPWIKDGDVGLFLYLGVGLGFTWFLFQELRSSRRALWLFVGGLVLSTVIVIEDSLVDQVRNSLPLPGFWDTAFEEIGEIWAQLLFLLSFLSVLELRVSRLYRCVRSG